MLTHQKRALSKARTDLRHPQCRPFVLLCTKGPSGHGRCDWGDDWGPGGGEASFVSTSVPPRGGFISPVASPEEHGPTPHPTHPAPLPFSVFLSVLDFWEVSRALRSLQQAWGAWGNRVPPLVGVDGGARHPVSGERGDLQEEVPLAGPELSCCRNSGNSRGSRPVRTTTCSLLPAR